MDIVIIDGVDYYNCMNIWENIVNFVNYIFFVDRLLIDRDCCYKLCKQEILYKYFSRKLILIFRLGRRLYSRMKYVRWIWGFVLIRFYITRLSELLRYYTFLFITCSNIYVSNWLWLLITEYLFIARYSMISHFVL